MTRVTAGTTPLADVAPNYPAEAAGNDSVIQVHDLRMNYGAVEAVRGVDLEVHRGEIFAFLGPNGAGKTSTVEILEGFRRATSGHVRVLGQDPASAGGSWRARLGVVLQESRPEAELKVDECLALYAGYYPAPRQIDEVLTLAGLLDKRNALCSTLSGGQRRRLDVAVALIGDPELLFLDEPTTGFDPAARRATWEVIAALRSSGRTIFLTTHYLEEAEYLADRICIIAQGRIVAEGTPAGLGGRDSASAVVSFRLPEGLKAGDLPAEIAPLVTDPRHQTITFQTVSPIPDVNALTTWAMQRGIDLPNLQITRPTLEDIYLRLIREDAA